MIYNNLTCSILLIIYVLFSTVVCNKSFTECNSMKIIQNCIVLLFMTVQYNVIPNIQVL